MCHMAAACYHSGMCGVCVCVCVPIISHLLRGGNGWPGIYVGRYTMYVGRIVGNHYVLLGLPVKSLAKTTYYT